MKKLLITVISLFLFTGAHSQVIISELMQSNIDCVMDDENQFPDSWVELYNTSNAAEDASQYSIGEDNNPATAWHLPAKMLLPKRYQLIYCDNESKGYHTNFKLNVDKASSIYLFKKGVLVDSITIPTKMPAANVSYGRLEINSNIWGFQETPTPLQNNCNSISDVILSEPIFSIPGGVYTKSNTINLSMSIPEDAPKDTEIRYTMDGSEPTKYSQLYKSPLTFSSTKVIRAKLFHKGCISPRSTTQSYIFLLRDMTLPVISINTNKEFLYDNQKGIYVDGTYNSSKKNYQYDWRRPINIEMFDNPNQESVINQLCETRVAGAASRGSQLKSLAIYSNKRFGKKKFKYEFFPDQRPEQKNFKSLVLRNAGNDFDYLYMRDAIAQRTFATYTDIDYQAWRPSIIYINGTYKGILNIRERGNGNNIYTNYNELEDIDVIENWNDVKEGDKTNLNDFKQFFNEHNHTYEEYAQWMDIKEFINYWAMNCYFNNIDFPGNNIMMWRPRTEDGKWRFIAKDLDYTMGIYNQHPYNYKYINWLYNHDYDPSSNWANSSESTRLFRRLMEDKDFSREFIDHISIYMGDFLNYDKIWNNIWEPMYNVIKEEYPIHRKLINMWWPNYSNELESAHSWVKQRTDFLYQHLSEYYKLGTPRQLEINNSLLPSEKESIIITINGIPLTNNSFIGKFYESRNIQLSGEQKDNSGIQITGWDITEISTNGTIKKSHINGTNYSFQMPSCSQLLINSSIGIYNDIDSNSLPYENDNKESNNIEYYNLQGIKTNTLSKGINIIRSSNGKVSKIIY